MKKYVVLFIVVVFSVIFTSCNKGPVKELELAQQALVQAESAQANIYLEPEYLALQDSMNTVNAEIEAQKSKVFGKFGPSKQKLTNISQQATDLVSKTEAKKTEIKNEITSKQANIQTLMAENNQLAENAPKGKEGKAAIEAIKVDLAAINASASEVPTLVAQDDLLSAQTKINAAYQKANEINTELKTVMAKYTK